VPACFVPEVAHALAVVQRLGRHISPMTGHAAFGLGIQHQADLPVERGVDHLALLAEDADAVNVLFARHVEDQLVHVVRLVLHHHEARAAHHRVGQLQHVGNGVVLQLMLLLTRQAPGEEAEGNDQEGRQIDGELELERGRPDPAG